MKNLYKSIAYIVGGIAAIWLSAKFFIPIGMPFLIGWSLSKLAQTPVHRITHRTKLPHGLVSFVSMTLLAVGIVLIFWLLGRLLFGKIEELGKQIPSVLTSLSEPLGNLRSTMLHFAAKLPSGAAVAATQWVERLFEGSSGLVDSASQWVLGLAAKILSWIPEIALFLVTTVLSAYFFAAQEPAIHSFFQKHLPQTWRGRIKTVAKRLKSALGGYVKAQLRLSVVTFGVSAVGLLILKREHAIWLAACIALIDALPVFGAGTILIPLAIVSFFSENTAVAIGLLAIYAVAAISRAVLEPRFLGKQIGLSPLLTLLALYSGFRLFGVLGMIVVPVAAIAMKQLYDLMENA